MKLSELEEQLEELNIDKKAIKAFLKLIDHKIENDMDKAVTRLEAAIDKLNTKLESSIGSLKESILSNRSEMNTSIGSLKWTIISVCTATAAIVGLIIKFVK